MRLSMIFAMLSAVATMAPALADVPQPEATLTARTDQAMRMTVPVMIGKAGPYQFVVDTGSDRSVVSREVATALALPTGRTVTMHSMTGVARQETVIVPALTIAGRTTGPIDAPALPEDYLGGHGLLGIDMLQGRRVVMDFAGRTMTILRSGQKEAYDPETIVVTARSRYGQLVLVDADVDGTAITVIIDSGAQNTIGNAPLRLLLSKRNRRLQFFKTELIDVTGGKLAAEYAAVGRLRIAGITLDNAVIAFAEAHPFKRYGLLTRPAMLLGMDMLRGFRRVSVDFAQRKVRFLAPGVAG